MRRQLLAEIQWQNQRLQHMDKQLKGIGYYLSGDFFYGDALEEKSEEELIAYLIGKSIFYDEQYSRLQQPGIGGMELFELLGEAVPEEILSKVYGKQWVYDWMERVKDGEKNAADLLEYLREAGDERQ
ncbi:hypothetical protein [Ectobacillus ponti]|uniref:Uncharacterized protein n=1 Tax=Ectobacillus ponti TaxID=2961894 RepID=A0AA41X7L9_9BACI|nr:hypothetical protein [Ectobacillus ponti]MCP8967800.1 hypothetical protein [Ectobacillus ponti]